jgi:hypothetical protein
MLSVNYFNVDFSSRQQPILRQRVSAMRWSVRGWCESAEVQSTGDYRDVGSLLNLLRCPVEIWDEHGDCIWWGFTNSVSYSRGSMRITYSLENMFNSVKVIYSYIEPGVNEVGTRKDTAVTTDADSVAYYGTKELIRSVSGMTDAAAIAIRDNTLTRCKYPRGYATGDGGGLPSAGSVVTSAGITIGLKGWWETMGWQYANVTKVGIKYSVSNTAQSLGAAAANTKLLQQFTVGTTAMYVVGATFRITKVGAPTDNVTYEIYALDGSGNPTGSALATGATYAGTALSTSVATNARAAFTTPVTLTAGTQYGVVVARSGAVSGTNYYSLAGDSAVGYTGGAARLWGGAAWGADIAAFDSYFRIEINPLIETSQQIKDLVITYGTLLDYSNTTIINASGIYTHANKGGETTALAEIMEMQSFGYSDGGRMVVKVSRGRNVEIYKASTTPVYKADSYNRIFNLQTGEPMRSYIPPIGTWVMLSDLMPETADTSRLIVPGLQYLEAYEWRNGETTPIYETQDEFGGMLTA